MKPAEVARMRLVNQQLCGTPIKTPAGMVSWFGAIQGQEYAQTKWGIGLRLNDATDGEIETNLATGKIIRTHLLRPTWHFVSADDIRWLLELTAGNVHAVNRYMYRQLELDKNIFRRCNRILTTLLEGGKELTRSEINAKLGEQRIIAAGHRLSYIMMQAELEGIICSGARRVNQFTYALLDERIPEGQRFKIDKDEALACLTKVYFQSRGPATLHDFSTWSGLTIADCKRGVMVLYNRLEVLSVGRSNYYVMADLTSEPAKKSRKLYLLPIYDEFVMGYKDRSAMLASKKSLGNDVRHQFNCMIVFDGQFVGSWRRTLKQRSIDLEVDFLQPLTGRQKKSLADALEYFEQFHSLRITSLRGITH
jgi:hypothetical protein